SFGRRRCCCGRAGVFQKTQAKMTRTAPLPGRRAGRKLMTEAAKPAFPAMSIEQAHALITAPGSMFEVGEAEVHGATLKVWKNAPPTLREVFAVAALFGARDHLVLEDERATI